MASQIGNNSDKPSLSPKTQFFDRKTGFTGCIEVDSVQTKDLNLCPLAEVL